MAITHTSMNRKSTTFLRAAIVLIGMVALLLIVRFPLTEGRAAHLDLFSIYFRDPFLAYGYLASIPFFVALYQAYTLLGYIGQNKVFSPDSVKALRTIKYCAIIQSALTILAAGYIRIFHNKNDDPAGFLALAIVMTFISLIIATAAAVFERLLQTAVTMKSENDLTV